ncbi:MAG: NAD(P)-dependent oxidoreductase [Arenimonas sp.]
MSAISRVGFIGLGAMGAPMAGHLQAKGLLAAVGNRTLAKAEALAAELGVRAARAPADFADCDAVVLCVSRDADVLQCVDDLAGVLTPGALVIDHSTVSRDTAIEAARRLAAKDIEFLDAPVSGGVEGARNGKLSVMVGGAAEALARAQDLLSAYALRVTHMGPTGAGQATKAVNQVLVAGIAQAVCEGLAFGEALGLKPESLVPTLAAGAAGNWFLDKRGATMMADRFTPGFKSALLLKDLGIVQAMAEALGKRYSVVEQSLADYAELVAQGRGEDDTSALILLKR